MNLRLIRHILLLCQARFCLFRLIAPFTSLDLGHAPRDLARAVDDIQHGIIKHRAAAAGVRKATATLTLLRDDLWLHAMRPVALIARLELSHIPELAALRLPRRDASLGALILSAHSMADLVTRHQVAFRQGGLGKYAAQNLCSLAGILAATIDERDTFSRDRAAHAEAILTSVRTGRRSVQLLDTLLASALPHRPLLLAQWNAAKRIAGAPITPWGIARRRHVA